MVVTFGGVSVLSLSSTKARICGGPVLNFLPPAEDVDVLANVGWRCGPSCSGSCRKVGTAKFGMRRDGLRRRVEMARLKAGILVFKGRRDILSWCQLIAGIYNNHICGLQADQWPLVFSSQFAFRSLEILS